MATGPSRSYAESQDSRQPRVLQAETADGLGRAINRDRQIGDRVEDEAACKRVPLIVDDGFHLFAAARRKIETLIVEPAGTHVGEEHAAHPPDHAERRERGLDDRETQLRIREKRVLTDKR